ncbi:MAG: inorganic phosphate transporter [Bacteroidetes bacterium]|nr:inorganic phosphate transporter [Bacteroidota bacterium]
MIYLLIFVSACFLAYSNGANDNFKGVATLFGSGTTNYKKAINWATITTALGSIVSIFFASVLVKNFSGKGLVPDQLIATPQFAIAVAMGAALTIMIATKIGMPVSTTHGLVGALTGVGLMAVGSEFNFGKLGSSFFLPLIASPFIAAILSIVMYYFFTTFRRHSGITKESCICVTEEQPVVIAFGMKQQNSIIAESSSTLKVGAGTIQSCTEQYNGTIIGISAQKVLDTSHYISAGAVSFARGLNDTPKMVGLLLLIQTLDLRLGAVAIAIAIALGGLLNAKKVGETMSKKITEMNHGQGFTANLVTALLVSTASFNGLPVSTTHVSVGSLFGIGTLTKKSNTKVISSILLSWVLTLPVAALISGFVFLLIKNI